MQEQIRKEHKEKMFFLNNFDIDRVFGTIERADYLFLYYIKNCAEKPAKEGRFFFQILQK